MLKEICKDSSSTFLRGRRGNDRMYGSWIYNYLCNQCLSVVSSNPDYGEVYSIQRYEIKFSVTCGKSVVLI